MEEEDLEDMMLSIIMKFSKERERRGAVQQAVESIVKKVSRFNRSEVPKLFGSLQCRDDGEGGRSNNETRVFSLGGVHVGT
mgnify:CR=1 FL=1